MRKIVPNLQLIAIAMSLATACGSSDSTESDDGSGSGTETSGSEQSGDGTEGGGGAANGDDFQLSGSDDAEQAHGENPSEIEATPTEAAMRLFVVHPDTGPIEGIVIKMVSPDGTAYYTRPTDSVGYAEVLVPVGQRYSIEYLALGRRTARANVDVPEGPNQDIRLTMRHRGRPTLPPETAEEAEEEQPGLVLEGILFDTGAATIQEESFPRLDRVVEYMEHMEGVRIRITGHTDNVGNPRRNMALSEARAEAVREYLVMHDIDGGRVEAVGHGDQNPVASNDTADGQAQNRRIEAIEL